MIKRITTQKVLAVIIISVMIISLLSYVNITTRADNSTNKVQESDGRLLEGIEAYNNGEYEAEYLGILNYGKEGVDKDHKNDFSYRFNINGSEVIYKMYNGTMDSEGRYDYPLQNQLKEGYPYKITVKDSVVTDVTELPSEDVPFAPQSIGVPGEKTVTNFLKNAMGPIGTSLYIYGGAWDWQDVGSSIQARTIGVPKEWVKFFNSQDVNFTYKNMDAEHSFYPFGEYNEYYYAGADCSGYVGWALYNTFNTENGLEGYVGSARNMAKDLADAGLGEWTKDIKTASGEVDLKPGDIMSISAHHIWICLGTCDDGSILIAHCSPSDSRTNMPGAGAQISAIGTSTDCEAYKLADEYMSKYYPKWYERYPIYLTDPDVYLDTEKGNAGRFRWTANGLSDYEGIQNMKPADVLKVLFPKNETSDNTDESANDNQTVKVESVPKTDDKWMNPFLIIRSIL